MFIAQDNKYLPQDKMICDFMHESLSRYFCFLIFFQVQKDREEHIQFDYVAFTALSLMSFLGCFFFYFSNSWKLK